MTIYKNLSEWSADTALPKAVARSSSNWTATGSVVVTAASMLAPASGYQQVGSVRPGRKTIIISNIGTNAATLSNVEKPPGLGILLGVGAVWVLDTEGEVWCRSQLGTIVDVVELYQPIVQPGEIPYYGRG